MTMKDLATDTVGLPRAGKIRLGYKVKNAAGKEYPKEADHFVLRDVPEVAAWAREALGTDKPQVLPIFFPFDAVEDCLEGFYKLYFASGLWCRGDGDKILYSVNTTSGKADIRNGRVQIPLKMNDEDSKFDRGQEVPCPGHSEENRWDRCEKCKAHMTLKFLIRGLPVESLRMATYVLESNSINNYVYLLKALNLFKERGLQGIPFLLRRVQREISIPNLNRDGSQKSKPGGGHYSPRTLMKKWLVELEVDPAWVAQMMEREGLLADPMREIRQIEAGEPAEIIEMPTADTNEERTAGAYTARINFCVDVAARIKFYKDPQAVVEAMETLEIVYTTEEEKGIFDALETYAQEMADKLAEGPGQKDEMPF